MSAVIKTGLLSYGLSGRIFHAPFIAAHQGFELSAVVERSSKNAQLDYPDINSFDSVDALLADENIELVIVNTPNSTHFEFALKALQQHKHVLVEKPFTVTSTQAHALFDEAKRVNRQVFAYQNRRCDSDFAVVKAVLDSGRLGKLVEAHFRFDRYKIAVNPKAFKEIPGAGNGLFYDLGPHLLDQVISVFGPPLRWDKHLGYFRPNAKVDDYACVNLTYPEDLRVSITMSLLVAKPLPAFVLHGTLGSFVKPRADVQEQQLMQGMDISDPLYGLEAPANAGVLTTVSEQGLKEEEIKAKKSSYMQVFNWVHDSIKNDAAYPVTRQQTLTQIEILEG